MPPHHAVFYAAPSTGYKRNLERAQKRALGPRASSPRGIAYSTNAQLRHHLPGGHQARNSVHHSVVEDCTRGIELIDNIEASVHHNLVRRVSVDVNLFGLGNSVISHNAIADADFPSDPPSSGIDPSNVNDSAIHYNTVCRSSVGIQFVLSAQDLPFLVKDINPAPASPSSGASVPSELTNVNGTLFFTAFSPTNGTELWRSDGTPAGTVLVKDIEPGLYAPGPSNLMNFNGTLFFNASDPATGRELWRSDGTAAGTVLVKDIYPGPKRASSTRTRTGRSTGLRRSRSGRGSSPGRRRSACRAKA